MGVFFGAILALGVAVAAPLPAEVQGTGSAGAVAVSFRRPVLVPEPQSLVYHAEVPVRLSQSRIEVFCGAEGERDAACDWVAKRAAAWFGWSGRVTESGAPVACEGNEGYSLSAEPGRIALAGNSIIGVKYAMYTLRQAAERMSGTEKTADWWLPALEVKDAPALAFRGLHLCWFPELNAAFIEREIRVAASYKFNYLILEPWGVFRSERHPEISSLAAAPLTVAEARRLARVAREAGVTIVPQFNVFGHAAAARARGGKHITLDIHPEYAPIFEPAGGWNWCLTNPETRRILRDLVTELHDAFGSPPFFHIGCDEADEASCATCRAVRPYGALVLSEILEIHDLLKTRGARVMMWHDMLLEEGDPRWKGFYARATSENARTLVEGLPRDIVICDWYYGEVGRSAANVPADYPTLAHFASLGFTTVTAPWTDFEGTKVQGRYAREHGLFGLLQTTWDKTSGIFLASIMETGADAAWGRRSQATQTWTHPFAGHWRQIGCDMGIRAYEETGLSARQIGRDCP